MGKTLSLRFFICPQAVQLLFRSVVEALQAFVFTQQREVTAMGDYSQAADCQQ